MGDSSVEADWAKQFKDVLYKELTPDGTYAEGAAALRHIVTGGHLKHDDLHKNPERFFAAHRILAEHALALGPGHWIRFTVHYNLCMGTVLAVGSEAQVKEMCDLQQEGALGCFGLTERFAGVNSGMIVQVEAAYEPKSETFSLNSPNDGAVKNWISQGLTADVCVVMADLKLRGISKGPHAFFVRLRDGSGRLLPGVTVGDMGKKTIGNDLDNAWIKFDHVKIPRAALLSRYASVSPSGNYSKTAKVSAFEMVGQRLFTGRVAVAQAALIFTQRLFDSTYQYAHQKKCWGPKGSQPSLSEIPQLRALFEEGNARLANLRRFTERCESELCAVLRRDAIPPPALQLAIACAKVACVEHSIELAHRLKQEVGSYALMGSAGFIQMDFLTCCKFAEGDSRILLLKMARDSLKAFSKSGMKAPSEEENALCLKVGAAVQKDGKAGWDREWKSVYALGWAVVNRTVREWTEGPGRRARL